MIDDWYSTIEIPVSLPQFSQLPQNAAYKYEYSEGKAWLSPRPKNARAILDLASFSPAIAEMACDEKPSVRPLADGDWEKLPPLFAAAFHRVQPFASLSDAKRRMAAEDCIRHTRQSGDGPVIGDASFVAADGANGNLVGAVLITRPNDDATASAPSRPHLTWIFVAPMSARQGVGTALLDAAVGALVRQDCRELRSTFLVGNDASALWHWRAGFRLLPDCWSWRATRQAD